MGQLARVCPRRIFVPDAWIGVGELDILRDEGIAYGEKLKKAGHSVVVKIYEKSPHPIMAMDGESICCAHCLMHAC